MDENIVELAKTFLTIIGTLAGAFLGVHFTRKTQLDLFNNEMMIVEQKEKRNRIEKTMRVYSEIIRVDGENTIVVRVGGHVTKFDFETYIEKIRPVIFDGFIFIHSDVAGVVDDIDSRIAECNFNEEALEEDHAYLRTKYFNLINTINSHFDVFRKEL